MHTFSRRSLLALAAGASLAPAKTLSTIGVQLYTVRTLLPEKPADTLKALEQIGFREAEVVRASMDAIWPALKQTALKPVSLHIDTPLFMKDAAKLPAALEDAAKRGFQYVVCPYIAPADRGGIDVIKRLAETLNKAGQQSRANGMTLAYHNHAFEFAPAGDAAPGKTLLDVLLESSDPKNVTLELDMFWSKVAGVDPVALLRKYKGRVPLMHVKNLRPGTETRFTEGVPKDWFMEAGKGVIDVAAVLRAGTANGVKHFFVEQDQTPGNPVDSLRESFAYLQKLNF